MNLRDKIINAVNDEVEENQALDAVCITDRILLDVPEVTKDRFDEGVLFACAMGMRESDDPMAMAAVLVATGLQNSDVSQMDEFDKIPLKRINRERGMCLKF